MDISADPILLIFLAVSAFFGGWIPGHPSFITLVPSIKVAMFFIVGLAFGSATRIWGFQPQDMVFPALFAMAGSVTNDREDQDTPGTLYLPSGIFFAYFPMEIMAVITGASTLWMILGNVPDLALVFVLLPFLTSLGLVFDIDPVFLLSSVCILFFSLYISHTELSSQLLKAQISLRTSFARRKIYRCAGLFFPCVLLPLTSYKTLSIVLWLLSALLWSAERWKRTSRRGRRWLMDLQKPVSKEGEEKGTSGTTLYITGCALSSLFFGPAAPLGMIMATLGDAWAVLAGQKIGKFHLAGGKTVEGSIASFSVCVISGLVFFYSQGSMDGSILPSLVGASAATFAELLSGKADNLVMPVSASAAIWLVI